MTQQFIKVFLLEYLKKKKMNGLSTYPLQKMQHV